MVRVYQFQCIAAEPRYHHLPRRVVDDFVSTATMPKIDYPETWTSPPPGPVLVLAPHPDDESIGCGGLIALHRRQGDDVHVVVATDGQAGDPEGRYEGQDYAELRRSECRAAAEILDTAPPIFLGERDQALAQAADLPARLEKLLRDLRPATLYHPPASDMHEDHYALGEALEQVLPEHPNIAAYSYEIWSFPTPTHVIDISSVWDVKRRAIECYASQLAYSDYARAIEGLNRARSVFLPWASHVEAVARTSPGAAA